MDIYLFGIIILTIGSLVIAILVMYQHSLTLRDTISTLERSVEAKLTTIDELEPTSLASRLESSQTMRRLQAEHIVELREEIQRIEDELITLNI